MIKLDWCEEYELGLEVDSGISDNMTEPRVGS